MNIDALVIILLFVANIGQIVLSHFERQEYLDRLMAKNLPEYKDNVKVEENKIEPEDDGTVELEDAKDEILNEDAEN